VHGGRVEIQQTLGMLDIFQARRAADHSVTEKLHQTSFFKSSRLAALQLSQFFFTKPNWTQKLVPVRESWGMLRT
jgi:hypothetical protein